MQDDVDEVLQRLQAVWQSKGDPPLSQAERAMISEGQGGAGLSLFLDTIMSSGEAASRGPPRVIACSLLPRHQQSMVHDAGLARYELQPKQSKDMVYTRTTVAAAFTHGIAPSTLDGLERVSLSDVARRVNEIQLTRVLFARVTRRALRHVGTTVFIEDCNGDGIDLALYNYVLDNEDPQALLPEGQYLAVMQPYMRYTNDDPVKGYLILRCDNPQAILLFEDRQSWEKACRGGTETGEEKPEQPRDTWLASIRAVCESANAEFRAGRIAAAVRLYSHALDALHGSRREAGRQELCCEGEGPRAAPSPTDWEQLELSVRLLANRSAALMRQEKWARALEDSDLALSTRLPAASPSASSPHQAAEGGSSAAVAVRGLLAKCRFRRALALLLLQRPADALAAAAAEAAAGAEVTEAAAAAAARDWAQLRRDAGHMLAEQRDGRYDMTAMEAEAAKLPALSLRLSARLHADYESPAVRLRSTEGPKGRSMTAAALLPAGTLIMASRAFTIQCDRPRGDQLSAHNGHFALTKSRAQVLAPLVRQLVEQPERGEQLYSLSGGPGYEGGSGETRRVDVPRMLRILYNNWFNTTSQTDGLHRELRLIRWQRQLEHPPSREEVQRWEQSEEEARAMRKGTGLWIRPSLFNHSCTPNCTYHFIADFMLIFTTQTIPPGAELCLSYLDIYSPFIKREEKLRKWNLGCGFACDCPRCSLCRRAPALAELETELREAYVKTSQLMPRARRNAAHKLLEGLPDACQAGLLDLLEMEGCTQMEAGKWQAALGSFRRMLTIMGAVEGSSFMHLRRLQVQLSLCAAALLAGKGDSALSTMRSIIKGCCPPWGTLSIADVEDLAEHYDFSHRAEVCQLLAAARGEGGISICS